MSLPEAVSALECRALAAEAMERAAANTDPQLRALWLAIAQSWHEMAAHIERIRAFNL